MKALRTVVFLCALLVASSAFAQEDRVVAAGYETAWYLLGGLSGGASFAEAGNGGFLGGEASVVGLRHGFWYGVYADAIYDFEQQTAVITTGPEFGWMFVGFDGGVGFRPSEERGLEMGPQLRALLTFGVFSLYGRLGFWPEAPSHRTVRQFGVLLKLPVIAPWGMGTVSPWDMGGSDEVHRQWKAGRRRRAR